MLNTACSTSEPRETPLMSAAQPEPASESPFTPVTTNTEENTEPTTSDTPAASESPDVEPVGTALPTLPAGEADAEPVETDTPVDTPVSLATCTSSETDMQQRMLQLINDARATERVCGTESFLATGALLWNSTLASAAGRHSDDMATHNFFDHTGSDGSTASARVTAEGYRWRTVGENIAAGRQTAAETVTDWLESPGHCSNIMNPSFTEVAVACVENDSSDYRRYWTNVLAAPR